MFAVCSSGGQQPALDRKRHRVKITVIGVEVLKVDEQAFVMDEMRHRVPGRDVQLDQAIAGHPEGGDILGARPRSIIKVARWRDADQPFFAAERAQALRKRRWRAIRLKPSPTCGKCMIHSRGSPLPRTSFASLAEASGS
jgi:hypothetical protein